jgi:lauroyl/myristoyl acyltransferase
MAMVTDSILDLDVMAGNPMPYKLLSEMPVSVVASVFELIRSHEIANHEAPRLKDLIEKGRNVFQGIPALQSRAEELAEQWAHYIVRRKADWAMVHMMIRRPDFVAEHTRVNNKEILDNLFGEGLAPLVVSLHLDSFQAIPVVLAANGYPVAPMMDGGAVALLESVATMFYPNIRARINPIALPVANALQVTADRLLHGEVAMMFSEFSMGQSRPSRTGSFLGRNIYIPSGPAKIAEKVQRPIVPMVLYTRSDYCYCVQVEEPLYMPGDGQTVDEIVRAIHAWTEQRVLERPEQWWCWEIFDDMMVVR